MSKLGLTEEERSYLARVALARVRRRSLVGFYAGPLVPMIGFGLYGMLASEDAAVGIAFLGLAFFTVWRVAHEIAHVRVAEAIWAKVEAYQRSCESGQVPDPDQEGESGPLPG
ncbi:hypothetical protein [Pseudoxanthomonas sp. 10H]|uniref:hypothetical protein n=1 Tax=Pseudoxanthomonas sp. 10H TaxID=3242729 RepID=UPI0035576DB6